MDRVLDQCTYSDQSKSKSLLSPMPATPTLTQRMMQGLLVTRQTQRWMDSKTALTHPWHILSPSASVSPIGRGTPDTVPAAMLGATCACPQTGSRPQQRCAACQRIRHTRNQTAASAAPAMRQRYLASLHTQSNLVLRRSQISRRHPPAERSR